MVTTAQYLQYARIMRIDESDFEEEKHPRAANGEFTSGAAEPTTPKKSRKTEESVPGKLSAKEKAKVEELHGAMQRGEGSEGLQRYLKKLTSAEFKNRDPVTGRIKDEAKHEKLRWAYQKFGDDRDEHLRDLGADLVKVSHVNTGPNPYTELVNRLYPEK